MTWRFYKKKKEIVTSFFLKHCVIYTLVVHVEVQALVVARLSRISHVGAFIDVYGNAGADRRMPRLGGDSVSRWWRRAYFRTTGTYTLGLQPRSNRVHRLIFVFFLSITLDKAKGQQHRDITVSQGHDYYARLKVTSDDNVCNACCPTSCLLRRCQAVGLFLMFLTTSHSKKVKRQTNSNATIHIATVRIEETCDPEKEEVTYKLLEVKNA